ncbi:Oidioi.mRNA.OKI2018_I69.XSR.g14593.t1.cds [Oikopleura dioica]|uniref:Mesencephalic astrocyte-derived neurotrophic factor homolog n=1 Tax=Oikopleura dioica TaxID=34765 RepID=A0ABN7SGK7_OIKDI|nr:Oidioi.mRNA.OKI2018_I69.XSR.g14593.t1.cds [Oikopleura dioica]
MKLFFFGLATLAAASGECEVCETFLGKVEKVLTDENISDKGEIEKKLRAMCKEAKEQDNRFCYYTGLTPDAATTMHKSIVDPMSFKKPVQKICATLKKKDAQICDLKYPKPYDYSAINWQKIKVKELKKILTTWGEVCKNCLEKDEFVSRVKELMPKYVPKENWPAGVKDEL